MTSKSEPGVQRFKRILVAVDGSNSSIAAAKVAIALAKTHGSTLTILNVLYSPTYWVSYPPAGLPAAHVEELQEYEKKQANALIARVRKMAQDENLEAKGVVHASVLSVVQAISDYAAKEKIDLVVVGTRGLGGFKKLLIGSVSSGVVSHAPCSVLIVR